MSCFPSLALLLAAHLLGPGRADTREAWAHRDAHHPLRLGRRQLLAQHVWDHPHAERFAMCITASGAMQRVWPRGHGGRYGRMQMY